MTIVSNTFTTYSAKGIREDLSNVITNIAPEETPFMSNIGRESVSNTLFEFQTDTLAAAAANAQLEGDDVEADRRISEFEPGMWKYLEPGQNVSVPNISSPDQQYEMFVKNKVRRFASGFGCSYETLSRDFSETNYSSSRLSLLEDREHWKVIQSYLIENFNLFFRH